MHAYVPTNERSSTTTLYQRLQNVIAAADRAWDAGNYELARALLARHAVLVAQITRQGARA